MIITDTDDPTFKALQQVIAACGHMVGTVEQMAPKDKRIIAAKDALVRSMELFLDALDEDREDANG